jgi:hypothetical protein
MMATFRKRLRIALSPGGGEAAVANILSPRKNSCWRQIDLSGFVANRLSAFWY